jgi:putative aminopeptidase FrvX
MSTTTEAFMNRDELLNLLSELVACHAPPGEEGEIEAVIRREFEATGLEIWQDRATNVYAHLPGDGPKVMICAHKDELGMIVTHIREDGRLKVTNIGGSLPWKYGEGPVDILADDGSTLRAILSVGSVHTHTGPIAELKSSRALTWDLVTLFTGLAPAELAARGVHVGSRAVVARERKAIQHLGDYIASYALDDRMGLVALIAGLKEMTGTTQATERPDCYFVATHGEEIGMLGAIRAAQLLQPDICVALDTSPVTHDTPTVLDPRPIIWYGEAAYNNKADCDTLLYLAAELGFGAQPSVYTGAGSDAGRIKQAGLAGRTVAFGFPRDNSHGYEIAHAGSLANVTRLLVAYLKQLK